MSTRAVPADKLIGQVLSERYHVLERLGEGAMGVVYKARHIKVGRTFAVKVLHAHLLADAKTAVRFDREAALAGRLRHANVVGVVDVGEIDGLRYMVMDFAEGPDLAELLEEAPLPPARIIHLVRQMLEGLYHAHEQGLIHRDLKPENVIVERDTHGNEMPRLVDFGIAILRDRDETAERGYGRLTTNGLVLGTPHYMAPEQAVADPIDHRIDLFALGIVIYEMLCGRLPFDGTGAEIARANLLLDPPPIIQRVPYLEVDPLLEAFARRLMAKKPDARPATAKVARELLDVIDRDRSAAASALGLPHNSLRVPATTQRVTLYEHAPPPIAGAAPPTTRLRAAPATAASDAPSSQQPAGLVAEPAAIAAPSTALLFSSARTGSLAIAPLAPPGGPSAVMSPSTVMLSSSAVILSPPSVVLSPSSVLPAPPAVMPTATTALTPALSARSSAPTEPAAVTARDTAEPRPAPQPMLDAPALPAAPEASRGPLSPRELQTATRTPLDWPPAANQIEPPPRRRWSAVAVSLAMAGVVAVFLLARLGQRQSTPGAPSAGDSATAATVQPPVTPTASPRALLTSPAMVPGDRDPAPVPVPDTTPSSATGAVTTTPKAPARRTHANGAHANAVRSSDSKPDDIRASDITTADIKRSDIRSSDSKPGEREPGDSKPDRKRGARPTGPRPADERGNSWTVRGAPATGVDPSALSELYSTTAKVLAGLPSDKARDLRELFRRYNVLALVAAPQAERDEAAAQLSQILREARLRQDKPSAPRTDPRRQRTGPAPRA